MKTKLILAASLSIALYISNTPTAVYAQDTLKPKTPAKQVVKAPAPGAVANPNAVKPKQVYHAPVTAQQQAVKPQVVTPGALGQPPVYAETPASTDKSLGGQYQYVLTKVYRYQQPMIAALWKNINDSLNATKKGLKEANAKLSAQGQSISTLQNDVKTKDDSISEANSRRDEISLLGMYLPKSTYNIVMWGLVLGLGVALLVIVLRTSGAVREAKYRTQLYEELNEEFVAYKAKAGDKEKKLARELQTERNKVDELMGRG